MHIPNQAVSHTTALTWIALAAVGGLAVQVGAAKLRVAAARFTKASLAQPDTALVATQPSCREETVVGSG